ncbi:hypothetical protein JW824_07645 [bacterium]|nr:hypothetical protein [bacterium]
MKKLMTTIVILLLCSTALHAQNYAVDKGARIIMGMASYSSYGGADIEHRYNVISLTPGFNYFVASHIFLGIGLSYNRQSQGKSSMTEIGVGPNIGFAMGDRTSKGHPYIALGVRYRSETYSGDGYSDKATGSAIILAGGYIQKVKQHIGIILEAAYHIMNTSENGDSYSTNMIAVSVGIAGLLY